MTERADGHTRRSRRLNLSLPVLTVALAIPSWFLTTTSFVPLEYRASLSGPEANWAFQLTAPAWLFLESDLNVRAEGRTRPVVIISINDQEVTRLRPGSLYTGERARTAIPISHTRAGLNHLRVRLEDASGASFAMNLRVQNYHGINPRFPRAVVVADEAVASAHAARGPAQRIIDLLLHALVWGVTVWATDRLARRWLSVGAVAAGPIVFLWAGVVYSTATAFHLWLSSEALVTLSAVPALLVSLAVAARRHRRTIARAAIAIVVLLATMEVALRALNRIMPTPIFYTESYGRYRGQPGAPFFDTHLNSRGFNDKERAPAKPPGVHRTVAIGDSVAFGVVPRPHNYLALLEAELSRVRPVEIINMGVPGTNPADYLAVLVGEGLSFSPDLVLVNFYIGNDFESRQRRPHEYSFAATFIHFLWRVTTSGAPATVAFETSGGAYDDEAPTFGWERFLEIEVSRADIYVDENGLRDAAARAAGHLAEMHRIAEGANAKLLVAIIPDEVQVDAALREQVVSARGAPADRFDFMRPNRVLMEELVRQGIEHVDLTPVFQDAARQTRLFKPQDTHWNIAGNRLAAAVLREPLRRAIGE